jgi:WD40 repeat protein
MRSWKRFGCIDLLAVMFLAIGPLEVQAQRVRKKGATPVARRPSNSRLEQEEAAFGVWRGHAGSIKDIAFSPDGKTLASASLDKTIKLWSVATGQPVLSLEGHKNRCLTVAYSPDGLTLASGDDEGEIRLWDASTGRPGLVIHAPADLPGQGGAVQGLVFLADGKTLAVGSSHVWLFDVATGKASKRSPKLGAMGPRCLALSPDGSTLAWGGYSTAPLGEIAFWVPRGDNEPRIIKDVLHIDSVAFSPDGAFLVACGMNDTGERTVGGLEVFGGGIQVLDVRTGRVALSRLAGPGSSPACYGASSFSGDGSAVALATWSNNRIEIWSPSPFEKVDELLGHTDYVETMEFSPAGGVLASAGRDGTIRLWPVPTGPGRHPRAPGRGRPAPRRGNRPALPASKGKVGVEATDDQ